MWLFLDMNSYFASCEQQLRPELRGKPVGIAPMLADSTCFIAASYEAKCFGLKTGTGVAEARRLCPNVEIVAARPKLYREMHYKIVEAVERVVPLHEILSVDEMVAKPWANERTLADSFRLGQRVQDAIRTDVGEWMSCSIGLAPNAFLAKVASDLQKPRGLSVIAKDDLPHKLYGLSLKDWPGIAKGMARRFESCGVTTTEQMYQLSLRDMKDVFGGIVGERWWRLIRGEPVQMPQVRRWQIGHSNVLAPEFRTPSGAWGVSCRLLEKAGERLRAEGYHARRLTVSVSDFAGGSWTKTMKFCPTRRTYELLPILQRLWQGHLRRPSQVSVSLQDILPDRDVTAGLFRNPREAMLDDVTDAINRRFGRGTLTVASALGSKEYLGHQRIPFGKPTALR